MNLTQRENMDIGNGDTHEINTDLLGPQRTDTPQKRLTYGLSDHKVPPGMKLNLGCGSDIRNTEDGWTNLDKYPLHDLVLEWDVEKGYLPFEDDYFDHVLSIDFFEHIPHRSPVQEKDGELLFQVVADLMRVSKDGATWLIISPARADSLNGAGHCRLVTEGTWMAWTKKASSAERTLAVLDGRLEMLKVINVRQWTLNKFFGRAISKAMYLKVVKEDGDSRASGLSVDHSH